MHTHTHTHTQTHTHAHIHTHTHTHTHAHTHIHTETRFLSFSDTLTLTHTHTHTQASLRSLFVQNNLLVALPAEICRCQLLRDLRVSNNQLALLPEALGTLDTLTRLDVQGNRLVHLPCSLSTLCDLRVLNVSRNLLRELPENHVAPLTALTDLNLDANRLSKLPLALVYQEQLRFLRAGGNRIEVLEVDVVTLPALQELHLPDNLLRALPAHCWNRGQATRLVALDVCGNQLTDVPRQLALLTSLRVFGLARNSNLPLPILEASYTGADEALAYLQKEYQRDLNAHASKDMAEEEDVGDSVARLDAMRNKEKADRIQRLHAMVASNNNGVGQFYKAVAGMASEGIPAAEIDQFRGRLANRMLNEFVHEGFDKKALKKQNEALAELKDKGIKR